jgi:U3 small nucleolar RNA-associated protein 5
MPGAFKSSRKAHNARPTKIQPANGLQALVSGARPKPTAHTNGVRKQKGVDESIAQVLGGQSGGDVDMAQEIIEISSASDDDESSAEDDAMTGAQEHVEKGPELPAEDEAADAEELTFGDRLQDLSPTGEPRIVDVEDFDDKPKSTAATNNPLSVPSTSSLGTVLTQALRTNDHELLDTCLRVVDVDSIYATVERLPSPLVGNLISKLAERLHKKPGRAGVLMIWVQWSLAAHGAYLASSPQLGKHSCKLIRGTWPDV